MKYVVINREEIVLCSDTNIRIPQVDLKQDVKVFDTYEEAASCFRQAIMHTPKYPYQFGNDERLNSAHKLLKNVQCNSEYAPNNEDVIACEIGDSEKDKNYCLVTNNKMQFANIIFGTVYYLSTNVHNLSASKDIFYFFRKSEEDILNLETETTTITITITCLDK